MSFHQIIVNLFMVCFLYSFSIFLWGMVRKEQALLKQGCLVLLVGYILFLGLYFHGLALLKLPQWIGADAATLAAVNRHYKMAKFIFTTLTLMALASGFLLKNLSKDTSLPAWVAPNFLILYLTALTFMVRVVVTAWKIPG